MHRPHTATAALLLLLSASALAQTSPANLKTPKDPHVASLEDVTRAVTAILDQVKSDPAFRAGPQLTTAEFDFQTVTTTTATAGVGIFGILTLGASRDRDTTGETDFLYHVPPAPEPAATNALSPRFLGGWPGKVKNFSLGNDTAQILAQANDVLPAAIKAAALSMQTFPALTNPTGADLSVRSYTITLAFSVKDEFNAGEDLSSLVIVAPRLGLDHAHATVQTLKLTFADPPNSSTPHANSTPRLSQPPAHR